MNRKVVPDDVLDSFHLLCIWRSRVSEIGKFAIDYESGRFRRYRESALEYAFMMDLIDINE